MRDRVNLAWFEHDGAPAHFGVHVRQDLDASYGENWIVLGGPRPWPARSPDLTPLDFYDWGFMKYLVYSTPVVSELDWIGRIVKAVATIQERNEFGLVRQSLTNFFEIYLIKQ